MDPDNRPHVLVSPDDVDVQLARLGIADREVLVRAAREAYFARLMTTAHHPPGAGGTSAYNEGVRALRDGLVGESSLDPTQPGDRWDSWNDHGIAYAACVSRRIRIAFWNVDRACHVLCPTRISESGPYTVADLEANGQLSLDLGTEEDEIDDSLWSTWHLMVGLDGTAELSLTTGHRFLIRLFLVQEEDLDDSLGHGRRSDDDDDGSDDIEVSVSRRR